MQPALAAINSSLHVIDGSIHEMKNAVVSQIAYLHSEFQTSGNYSVSPMPDISWVLDAHRPPPSVDRQDRFTDNNIYFTDQGDDVEGDYGKLAPVPEPEHWPGFLPEEAMPPQEELQTEEEIVAEEENELDKENKLDAENKLDKEMKPSNEMTVDSMQQSPQMSTDKFNQTENYGSTNSMNQNHWYNQTNTNLGGK